jgi:hypothetical protein
MVSCVDKEAFEKYLKERYNDQIRWYGDKSAYNEKMFKRLITIVTVFSVLTPILLITRDEWLTYVAIVSSVLVAVGTTLVRAFHYQENWVNYRTTSETLKKEIHYYNAKLADYHDAEDPEALFVERVESLISRENTMWLVCQTPKKEPA